jgi:hypothetical protein
VALFDNYRLALEEVERKLARPLTGDPTRGEKAVLAAINSRRLGDVRGLLERDNTVGPDAKDLFEAHLREQAGGRWQTFKTWEVSLPLPIWDEYARESRLNRMPISRCLSSAIRRDYERRQAALDPAESLHAAIQAYHATQLQMLEAVRELLDRLGDIQNISLHVRRIASHLKVAS